MKNISLIILITLHFGCAHSPKILKPSDISYGHDQVRLMLKDRPTMSFYRDKFGVFHDVGPDDEIWKWTASQYAGQDFNKIIEWSPEPISKTCPLASNNAGKGDIGRIRVSENFICGKNAGKKLPFEYLWRLASFELLNIQGADEFKKISSDLKACKPITKEEYIRKMLSVEYQALVKQIDFYKNVWLSWAIKNSYEPDPRYWSLDLKPLDIWLEWLKNNSEPNGWVFYGEFYDNELMPYLKKKCYEL